MAAVSTSRTALVSQRVAVTSRVAKVCNEAAIVPSNAIGSCRSCFGILNADSGLAGHLGCVQ